MHVCARHASVRACARACVPESALAPSAWLPAEPPNLESSVTESKSSSYLFVVALSTPKHARPVLAHQAVGLPYADVIDSSFGDVALRLLLPSSAEAFNACACMRANMRACVHACVHGVCASSCKG